MIVREAIKSSLPKAMVDPARALLAIASPQYRTTYKGMRKVRRITEELLRQTGPVVQRGPFAGLEFHRETTWVSPLQLIIGSYEAELHDVIEELIERHPRHIVDVGCAEGYYAVGLARRLPDAVVFAFDINEMSQRACAANAQLNGVANRVVVTGLCSSVRLGELAGPDSVVMLDCEGCEATLLDPDSVPSLKVTTILVELHDFVDPAITGTILRRFRASHDIRIIDVAVPDASCFPELSGLTDAERELVIDEHRPTDPHPMQWALLIPLDQPHETASSP